MNWGIVEKGRFACERLQLGEESDTGDTGVRVKGMQRPVLAQAEHRLAGGKGRVDALAIATSIPCANT